MVHRTSQVRILPEAALLFLLRKWELSSGVVDLLCLVSMTDRSCMIVCVHTCMYTACDNILSYMYMYMCV